jgi:uncharacterized protein (TIGR02391 family)
VTPITPSKTLHPVWDEAIVEGVAGVLGDTAAGLTGGEIGRLLAQVRIPDPFPASTKRHRLYQALSARQATDRAANSVIRFICGAMAPVRYRDDPALFQLRQEGLNEVLVHLGLRVNEQGKVARGPKATTLSEAAQHANSVRLELRRRACHPEVLRYCTQEILERNAFHALLEATKSIAGRLRTMSGRAGDGAALIDETLTIGQRGRPLVAINPLSTGTELDEQKGFANLCRGLFGMFRNPTAHDPRIDRTVSDEELLETLTTISLIHRRLDRAQVGS